MGNLESRYHTLAPKLLIKTVTLISGYEKIHKTECTSVRERKQSHRRARTDLALTLIQLLAILQYTVIPSRLSLRLTTRGLFEQETVGGARQSKVPGKEKGETRISRGVRKRGSFFFFLSERGN